MLKEKTISQIDLFPVGMVVIMGFALGLILIESALEGAGVLPHMALRPEATYTAYQSVVQLLFGQVSLGCGIGAAFIFYKTWKER